MLSTAFLRCKVFAIGSRPIRRWDKSVPAKLEWYRKRHILFCGRAWERSGGTVVIEAFHMVRKELPDALPATLLYGRDAADCGNPAVWHRPRFQHLER